MRRRWPLVHRHGCAAASHGRARTRESTRSRKTGRAPSAGQRQGNRRHVLPAARDKGTSMSTLEARETRPSRYFPIGTNRTLPVRVFLPYVQVPVRCVPCGCMPCQPPRRHNRFMRGRLLGSAAVCTGGNQKARAALYPLTARLATANPLSAHSAGRFDSIPIRFDLLDRFCLERGKPDLPSTTQNIQWN